MSESFFVSGDLSGIQDYVLNVSAAGGGQARRLRARSFYVQAVGEVAAWRVLRAFGAAWDCALVSGGGQFLLRLPETPEAETKVAQLADDLSHALYAETRGELGLTLAFGRSRERAIQQKEQEKRTLWRAVVAGSDGWHAEEMSLGAIAPPCQICRHQVATVTRNDDGVPVAVCARCDGDTRLGKELSRVGSGGRPLVQFSVLGTSVRLHGDGSVSLGDSPVRRSLGRHVPADQSGNLLTFEQIAESAKGDNLLGILKADVDSMGVKLGDIARQDPSLQKVREFSTELDAFFTKRVQQELEKAEWRLIYTIYSGGDDLLLVGPWNLMLDFAGWVRRAFAEGPGAKYGLTLSAGIALTPYRLPVRHGVERADDLLEQAKTGRKDQCAALGSVWSWNRHDQIIGTGKRISGWIHSKVKGRSLFHRLLAIADLTKRVSPSQPPCDATTESQKPRPDPSRAAFWAYEIGRNFPSRDGGSSEEHDLRQWGEQVLANFHGDGEDMLPEVRVALRYALVATRSRSD
jgi:CRISPR-associated protein Csm1